MHYLALIRLLIYIQSCFVSQIKIELKKNYHCAKDLVIHLSPSYRSSDIPVIYLEARRVRPTMAL